MFQKSLLIVAIAAAACTTVQAQQTSSPAKKELVARIIKMQQPAIDNMARGLVQRSLAPLLERADAALQQKVPTDRREAVAKEIQADTRKYFDETVPLVRDRATRIAPAAVGPILEEKFTEEELRQVIAMLESPVLAKFQAAGQDIERALVEKTVAETGQQVEQRFRALEDKIAKSLGVPTGGGAAAGKPPAKK